MLNIKKEDIRKIEDIETQIKRICEDLSCYLNVEIGWSDARELATGMSMKDLLKQKNEK